MTYKEAIGALKWKVEYAKEIGESYIDCVNADALALAVKALEEDRWISVSERLPDKNGKCLVSLDFGDVSMDSFVDGIFVCYLGNVTHWKPLPKPYESEDSE